MVTFIDLNKQEKEQILFDKPGDYIVFLHNLSGDFTFDIQAENVNLDIFGIFIGKDSKQFSLHTIQHHGAPSSTSNLFIKGVFYDASKFKYQGLIRIEKEAQKSHAYQKNQNLVMSSQCFIQSKPYLEILANDVFCTHGSTTGKLNKDQLFYAKTRGLNEIDAQKMLIKGFINEIIDKIHQRIPSFYYDFGLN